MCPTPMVKAPEPALAYVPIPKQRYTSREFARLEWERMWTRVWLLAGPRVRRARSPATTSRSRSAPSRCWWSASATARSPRATTSACTAATGCASRAAATPSAFALPVPRLAVRHRRHAAARARSARASRRACRPSGSRLRPVRCETWAGFVFVMPRPGRRAAARLPRRDPGAPRSLPLRELEGRLRLHDRDRVQLEDLGRRLQRGLPPLGHARLDARVQRRREHASTTATSATRA